MAKSRRKITTVEILVAIGVVVFIFALIGILSLQTVTNVTRGPVQAPSQQAAAVPEPTAQITGNVAYGGSGTDLNPAEKGFQVNP